MTYIEFFDREAAENVCTCLTFAPERVIYLGHSTREMKEHVENYRKVFAARGQNIEFVCKAVPRSNLDCAVRMLQEIVDSYEDCVFDITGGEEMFNLALGVVYARNPEKNIQIHKINLQNNAMYDCDKDGVTVFFQTPALSVEENVRIYGGEVIYGGVNEEKTYRWELSDAFRSDVETVWSVCRGNVRFYNTQIAVFEAAEAVGRVSEDGLTTVASIDKMEQWLSRRGGKYLLSEGLTEPLRKGKLLTACRESSSELMLSYKDPQVKRLLTKAGLALEMKVYLTAVGLQDEEGKPVYNDALNGVVIDWDGVIHEDKQEGIYDTENEIDVLLLHGTVPVFISCKNGVVSSGELYKLDAVARRFGGKYAKRVLVATSIPEDTDAGQYLRQRARDMGIELVEKIQDMDSAQLVKRLKSLWR